MLILETYHYTILLPVVVHPFGVGTNAATSMLILAKKEAPSKLSMILKIRAWSEALSLISYMGSRMDIMSVFCRS